MRASSLLNLEVEPALLCDRAFVESLRRLGFNALVLRRQYELEATFGRCVYLRTDGMRQVQGRVEVLVDESPSPEVVKLASAARHGLRLDVPTGELARGEWDALRWPLVLLIGPWAVWAALFRLSGEPKRQREQLSAEREMLAQQPTLPSFLLVLRSRGAEEVAAGGGIEN